MLAGGREVRIVVVAAKSHQLDGVDELSQRITVALVLALVFATLSLLLFPLPLARFCRSTSVSSHAPHDRRRGHRASSMR